MDDAKWVGSQRLTPGTVEWDFSEKVTVDLSYSGPMSVCLNERPGRGATVPGYEMGLRVIGSKISQLDGGAGKLTVRLEAALADPSDVSFAPIGEPTFTVECEEQTRKLEGHPKCGSLSYAAIAKGMTWEDWPDIAKDGELYVAKDGGWDYHTYLGMKQRGVEEYIFYTQKVIRTAFYFGIPVGIGAGCNHPQNPPVAIFDAIGDYHWLGGPDRFVKSGKRYERTTEWWGFDSLDPVLYPMP